MMKSKEFKLVNKKGPHELEVDLFLPQVFHSIKKKIFWLVTKQIEAFNDMSSQILIIFLIA